MSIRRFLFALVLAASTAAAATLDLERPIAPPRSGPSSWQSGVQTATDGHNFLVIWADARSAIPANVALLPLQPMAQLIDPDGRILTTMVLPLFGTPVWFAGRYLVIGGGQYIGISADGVVLDTAPRPFVPASPVALASSGSRLLAVSQPRNGVATATLLDRVLNVLRSADIASETAMRSIAAASNGTGFAVFYSAPDDKGYSTRVHAVILDGDVNVVRSFDAMNLIGGVGLVHAASSGGNFLVVTSAGGSYASASIDRNSAVQSVTQFGRLDRDPINGIASEYALAATRDGYQLVSTLLGDRNLTVSVSVTPLTAYGAPGTPAPLFGTAPALFPTNYALIGNSAGRMMLLWVHQFFGALTQQVFSGELYDDVSDFAAHRDVPFRLGDGPFSQESPSAAVSGDGTALVTWREPVAAGGPLALYGARLAPDGTLLDPNSLLLADSTADNARPAVVSDGRDFFVCLVGAGARRHPQGVGRWARERQLDHSPRRGEQCVRAGAGVERERIRPRVPPERLLAVAGPLAAVDIRPDDEGRSPRRQRHADRVPRFDQ